MCKRITKLTVDQIKEAIPGEYHFLRVLGYGSYGQVVKCVKKDTNQDVAIKLPHHNKALEKELIILTDLMAAGMDQRYIVKLLDSFETQFGTALVFECLDMNLLDFYSLQDSVPFSDIQAVIDQVAIALKCLQTFGFVHTDLKFDNIMVCDRSSRPLQVKLIDFGLAVRRERISQDKKVSNVNFRAPEVILGLPYTEAIDVWALGIIALDMLLGFHIFPYETEFEILNVIVKLLGQPPDHVLQEGIRMGNFFVRGDMGQIRIMTRMEYTASHNLHCYEVKNDLKYNSLEELVKAYCNVRDPEQVEELDLCIDLLYKMLEVNAGNRITPAQIRQHPFITNYCEESAADEEPGVMMVKEADPENRTPLTEQDQEPVSESGRFEQERVRLVQSRTSTVASPASTSRVITVKPATLENTTPFIDYFQQCVSVNGGSEKSPATTERVYLIKSRTSTPISPQSTPEIMKLKPATPDNATTFMENNSQCVSVNGGSEKSPATTERVYLVKSRTSTPISPQSTPEVILVKPATPENTTAFTEDVEHCVSVTSGLQRTSATTEYEPLVIVNTTRLLEDQPSGSAEFESNNTSSRIQSNLYPSVKKKKKKNCFRRILSWMRKQFCCLNIQED